MKVFFTNDMNTWNFGCLTCKFRIGQYMVVTSPDNKDVFSPQVGIWFLVACVHKWYWNREHEISWIPFIKQKRNLTTKRLQQNNVKPHTGKLQTAEWKFNPQKQRVDKSKSSYCLRSSGNPTRAEAEVKLSKSLS